MDLHEVGARIRAARERGGLTQARLAGLVGVTRSAVAQWETGRAGQVGRHLEKIAEVLGVGVEFLLLGSVGALVTAESGSEDGLQGPELALLRLYRECGPEDQATLLRIARALCRRSV